MSLTLQKLWLSVAKYSIPKAHLASFIRPTWSFKNTLSPHLNDHASSPFFHFTALNMLILLCLIIPIWKGCVGLIQLWFPLLSFTHGGLFLVLVSLCSFAFTFSTVISYSLNVSENVSFREDPHSLQQLPRGLSQLKQNILDLRVWGSCSQYEISSAQPHFYFRWVVFFFFFSSKYFLTSRWFLLWFMDYWGIFLSLQTFVIVFRYPITLTSVLQGSLYHYLFRSLACTGTTATHY